MFNILIVFIYSLFYLIHMAEGIVSIIIAALIFLVVLFVMVFPLQMAARFMQAERSSALWCLLALVCSNIAQSLAPVFLPLSAILSLLLSAAVFAGMLGTSFLKGIGIALLHGFFSFMLIILFLALGLGFASAGSIF